MNKLVFDDVEFGKEFPEVSKKQFYESKKGVKLIEVDVNKIVVSNRVKGNNETSKVFTGYIIDDSVRPLCIILPLMIGWIKYFENGGKSISFRIEDDEVYLKYNEIWNKIRELLNGVKLSSDLIYDGSYIKTKVKTFSEVIKTLFDGNEIPKERVEDVCIPCLSICSVLKIDGKYDPQVYLEQCKYKIKKTETRSLIDYETDLDSDYESD